MAGMEGMTLRDIIICGVTGIIIAISAILAWFTLEEWAHRRHDRW
jgi:hypothetical protein